MVSNEPFRRIWLEEEEEEWEGAYCASCAEESIA